MESYRYSITPMEAEKEGERTQRTEETNNKMRGLTLTISVISINISGLSPPIKRQRLSNWIKKQLYAAYKKCTSL